MKQGLNIQEIAVIEPRVQAVLEVAALIENATRSDYLCLKKALARLVGDKCGNTRLQPDEAYRVSVWPVSQAFYSLNDARRLFMRGHVYNKAGTIWHI